MPHINPWNTAQLAWQAVALLWLITYALQQVDPNPAQRRHPQLRSFGYAVVIAYAGALLLWPRAAIAPIDHPLLHTPYYGLFVVYLGAAFAGLARLALGANWSSRARIRSGHTLATHGPYRIVRHPIYTGILLMFLGTAMILGQVCGYLGFVLAFAAWYLKSRAEDSLLAAQFGPQFDAYRARVHALIPGLL
jgi:protein-S-isoprenylcysteine O-methyltransferase Ste14